jgi:amino acid adenylation domain-containing protein
VILPELLEAAAGALSDREAITDGRDRLTWSEYRHRAATQAGALVAAGVRPGDRVGLLLPKSVASFVAVHAVQRIGAVVVPVDWFAPTAFVAQVLDDAGAAVVVGPIEGDRREAVERIPSVRAVIDPSAIAAAAPVHSSQPDDPAYIIYTSGSTGRPKGIVHTHRSALAYARLAAATYGLTPADRLANIAPLHFDQSTFELYAGPLARAAVVVVPDGVARFPASLGRLLESERATVLYTVPHVIDQLVTRGGIEDRDLAHLRWVKYGGESYRPAALRAAMAALPRARFSNVYGPAEVNQCTFHHLDAPPTDDRPVPIGRAWDDVGIVVVDEAGEPVDDRRVGELWVHAPTMMKAYWGRPDLTGRATAIDAEGRRWYRTGDLVRRDEAGRLVFVGRVDHQVKLRGQRIELEAVDAALAEHEAVRAVCTFVVRRDGDDELVAVVSPVPDDLVAEELLRLARDRLPRYAVPAIVAGADSLPRTATGKVDRRAAAADYTRRTTTEDTATP